MARGISPPRWAGSGLRRGTRRRHFPFLGVWDSSPWGLFYIPDTEWNRSSLDSGSTWAEDGVGGCGLSPQPQAEGSRGGRWVPSDAEKGASPWSLRASF